MALLGVVGSLARWQALEGYERNQIHRTAQVVAEGLARELAAFNYSVSHDLRSPLGAVLNFASILDEDYRDVLDAQGRDYLCRITSSAESALALMDGLLTFSRLGREEIKRASWTSAVWSGRW